MAGLPTVIGLLYRADWTRLSLRAQVRFETGARTGDGTLLIAPGGRWRLDRPNPVRAAAAAEGSDGERGWSWRPPEAGEEPPPLPPKVDGVWTPVPELFHPAGLLGGYTLEELGPVTAGGRAAIAIVATARPDVLRSGPGGRWHDRIEAVVDAETGLLLRWAGTSEDEPHAVTELTGLTMNPPGEAGQDQFAARPGSHRSEIPAKSRPSPSLGQEVGGLVAVGATSLLKHMLRRPGHGADEEQPGTAMPSPDPAPLAAGDGSPPPDEVLDLLYRSGEPGDLRATVRQWHDVAAMAAGIPEEERVVGHGVDYLGAVRGMPVTRTDARLRMSGRGRYRLDTEPRPGERGPLTSACDGERRWVVAGDRVVTGPAAPLGNPAASLADACWLLRGHLAGGAAVTYRGRPARQLRVTRAPGTKAGLGMLAFFPADAIVDTETGGLLRLLGYGGDAIASWWELDDISTDPVDPAEFQVDIPPGATVVEATGDLVTDSFALMAGPTGTAVRAAAESVRRTTDAVSAARGFLDGLRNRHE